MSDQPTWHDVVRPIVEEADDPLLAAFVGVLWESGARATEVVSLTTDDVTEGGHGFELEMSGKGPEYTVEIVAAAPFLRDWFRVRPQHDTGDDAIWTKRNTSGRVSLEALADQFQDVAKSAGVEVSFRDFRRVQNNV